MMMMPVVVVVVITGRCSSGWMVAGWSCEWVGGRAGGGGGGGDGGYMCGNLTEVQFPAYFMRCGSRLRGVWGLERWKETRNRLSAN